jgi:hypothetical protein
MILDELQSPSPPRLPFAVGDLFPDLELPLLSGGGRGRISEWRGTHLLLHLFASW